MLKKSLASIVSAAILVAGPGNLTLTAAAQTVGRAPVTGVSVIPTIGAGFNSPVPGASSFNMPTLAPGALLIPALTVAPRPVVTIPISLAPVPASLAARPLPAAASAMPTTAQGSPLSVIQSGDAKAGVADKAAALNALFDNSIVTGHEGIETLGQAAAPVKSDLAPYDAQRAAASFPVNSYPRYAALQKAEAAGSISDVTNLVKRAWNAVLGMLGIGVKKMETPAVMAQRIIDQLNAAKPVYNQKVAEASTLVEKLKLQVEGETAKVAELEQGITALLSDPDPTNDIMASGMINQQKTLNASIASTNEQIGLAETTLTSIKEARARFFSEREETMAKIQAGLTKSAAADIQKQIAELKGGFQIGDLKDNMDKFEDAVNDKVADAKGTVDSVESNPDQILKKAKDSLRSQEIKDELARRKAAIELAKKGKGAAGGSIAGPLKAVGRAVNVVLAVWAGLNTGWIAGLLGASAVMSVVIPMGALGGIAGAVIAEKVLKTSGAKTAGIAIMGAVIGYVLGVVAVGVAGYIGFAVASPAAAIGLGVAALVATVMGEGFKWLFGDKKTAPAAGDDKGQAGGKLNAYPSAVYMIGVLGIALTLISPVTTLAVAAALGILTLVENYTSPVGYGYRSTKFYSSSTKFYAFSSGIGVAALITLGLSGLGTPFYLAAGSAVLSQVLGRINTMLTVLKEAAGGMILELGIGAAVIAVIAAVSTPFRSLLARAWNAALGMGVKKMETPEVMAQRIINQLNAQKPVYNRKVQEASTLVEKLRLQIEKQSAQSADLDKSVTAILSDSDPLNDVMAESLLNQKKTVDASTAMTQEQLSISEKALVSIKEERASFFSEREEMLAKIQAGLTKSKSAEIQKQIAVLKGGFQVGDLKDNMDKFEDAVNDKVADAKGTVDSVESNPDQILKKAKDSLKSQEIKDELARRKAAIEQARKDKGQAGGYVFDFVAAIAPLIGIGFAGWLFYALLAGTSLVPLMTAFGVFVGVTLLLALAPAISLSAARNDKDRAGSKTAIFRVIR